MFYKACVRGVNAVTAVDPMQVDKTLTSEGELSVGEVDIYPGAKKAKRWRR